MDGVQLGPMQLPMAADGTNSALQDRTLLGVLDFVGFVIFISVFPIGIFCIPVVF